MVFDLYLHLMQMPVYLLLTCYFFSDIISKVNVFVLERIHLLFFFSAA